MAAGDEHAHADGCNLSDLPGGLWDASGKVTEVPEITMLVVSRDSRGTPPPASLRNGDWSTDIPSKTLGVDTVCDHIQFESPVSFEPPALGTVTVMRGERLNPESDAGSSAPTYVLRLKSGGRFISAPAGTYYVEAIEDQDDPDWREALLAKARVHGPLDRSRWVVGLPGALYLVPLAD